jgi:hypothetical protein
MDAQGDPDPMLIPGQNGYVYPDTPVTNMWVVAYQRAYLQAMGVNLNDTNTADETSPFYNGNQNVAWQDSTVAMESLIGFSPTNVNWTTGAYPNWLTAQWLNYFADNGYAITVSCPGSSANERVAADETLVGSHQYSLVSVLLPTLPGQQAAVLLRNPWAANPDGNQNAPRALDPGSLNQTTIDPDGGYVEVSWSDFTKYFNAVSYAFI